MALEHPRKAIAYLLARLADNDCPRYVGRAVLILSPGIDQEQFVGADAAVGRARHPVVHDCAVRSGAGNGWKGNVLERSRVTAEALQRSDSIDFSEPAGRNLLFEPGEKTRHGDAIALVCRAAADDLGMILRSFQQSDRIGAALKFATGVGQQARECV